MYYIAIICIVAYSKPQQETQMSFESHLIKPHVPNSDYTGAVGVYVPGIDANIRNTGNRIQEMVNQLGMPFLMTDVLPQGKPIVDEMDNIETRQANNPKGQIFRDMSLLRAEFVVDRLQEAGHRNDTVVAMGDSLGVPIVQGMQLYADDMDRFGAVLLRDGWNLSPTESATLGRLKYFTYQASNIARDSLRKVIGKGLHVPDHGWEHEEDWSREYGLLGMVRDTTDLMRSSETRRNAVRLAAQSAIEGFGLNIICFEKGLSGTNRKQNNFLYDVLGAYNENYEEGERYTLHAAQVPGWHSDLLDPTRAAQDVADTLKLL
jgi:hypothetical protein